MPASGATSACKPPNTTTGQGRGDAPIGVKIALDPARVGTILGQMQNTASLPADQFEELLRRLPAALDLDRLA